MTSTELLRKQQSLDKLRDFALQRLYDMDDPEIWEDTDAFFGDILREAHVAVTRTHFDRIVEVVKASRRDLARANTAFEHMRGLGIPPPLI